ncbi:MAG: hypothetical protein Q7J06_00470 [Bacteroidales bacterium]|nr:hypothetical protein [Bacteroidales bacterium]
MNQDKRRKSQVEERSDEIPLRRGQKLFEVKSKKVKGKSLNQGKSEIK